MPAVACARAGRERGGLLGSRTGSAGTVCRVVAAEVAAALGVVGREALPRRHGLGHVAGEDRVVEAALQKGSEVVHLSIGQIERAEVWREAAGREIRALRDAFVFVGQDLADRTEGRAVAEGDVVSEVVELRRLEAVAVLVA